MNRVPHAARLGGLLILAVLLAASNAVAQKSAIPWEGNLNDALKRAQEEQKPLMIAFNMDNEVANDQMARQHYRDNAVKKQAKEFICLIASKHRHTEDPKAVCPRFGTVTCDEHIIIEEHAKNRWLKTEKVDAPQHLFIKPDGMLYTKKVWLLSEAQLVKFMSRVLSTMFPDRYPDEPETKKPGKGKKPEAGAGGKEAGADAGEVKEGDADASLEAATNSELRRRILMAEKSREIRDPARVLVKRAYKNDAEAAEIMKALLTDEELAEKRGGLLLAYGFKGNEKGLAVVLPYLKDKDEKVRSHAAVALEDIASKKAIKDIKARLKREREDAVRKNLYRALGSSGRGESRIATELLKRMGDDSSLVRKNVIVALEHFPKSKKVDRELVAFIEKAFRGGGGRRRGRGGMFDRSNEAAIYTLTRTGSKKGVEAMTEGVERLGRGRGRALLGAVDATVKTMREGYETEADAAKARIRAAEDKIPRDQDPEGAGGRDRDRNRRDRGGEGDGKGEGEDGGNGGDGRRRRRRNR